MTTAYTEVPRIYVASLADYNAGNLHGLWIDLDPGMTHDDVQDQIDMMLHTNGQSIAEEWAIHDYENFDGIKIDEYETIDRIVALADAINEHGPAYAAWVAHDPGYNTDPSDFEDAYQGQYESEEAFAESLVDEDIWGGELIPESLKCYLDYEKMARDLFMGDYYSVDHGGSTYIFRSY